MGHIVKFSTNRIKYQNIISLSNLHILKTCSSKKAFLALLAILSNYAFSWVYLSLSPLSFTSLLFSAVCKSSSGNSIIIQYVYRLYSIKSYYEILAITMPYNASLLLIHVIHSSLYLLIPHPFLPLLLLSLLVPSSLLSTSVCLFLLCIYIYFAYTFIDESERGEWKSWLKAQRSEN